MTKANIINKFNEIEKNIKLCNNPKNGNFAFGVIFKTDKFMTYYNDFHTVYEKSNFKLFSIKTDSLLEIVTVFIAISDISSYDDRIKMKTFLMWASENGIIDFYS